jgi:hypothetical protein
LEYLQLKKKEILPEFGNVPDPYRTKKIFRTSMASAPGVSQFIVGAAKIWRPAA